MQEEKILEAAENLESEPLFPETGLSLIHRQSNTMEAFADFVK